MAPSSSSIPSSVPSSPSVFTANGTGPHRDAARGQHEPIAIVGMGCRLPGDVNSPSRLWDFLKEGKSGQCKIPSSRFNVDAFYHPKGVDRPGSMHTTGGYFLQEDPRAFDPDFFGISPIEATYMDPQQRKLLEVVFEAFESAGASLDEVSGSNVGCYVGNFTVDFQVMQTRDPEYLHRYSATGMGTTILANRISHTFNLKGPSFVLDTACSSSLYCLHVACAALENGECDSAVVAGANLIQSPEQHLGTMKAGVLSGTSTCHTFSDEADGYGRAEGIGCIYLKRLSDAIKDNDPIRAIIRGTAVNSNGRTSGITLPSAEGQEAVIRKAYEKAALDFSQTMYVECHGTGTPVGDPIEAEGLSKIFHGRTGQPLLIGSVKSNLGHSEAASGISGIIKTVLALEHESIPASIGVNQINPKIKCEEWNIDIVKKMTPWPSTGTSSTRRAGVNSFGYGGANAHAIIESAGPYAIPMQQQHRLNDIARSKVLIPISAGSEASLTTRVDQLHQYVLSQHPDLTNLLYTLGSRRSHLPYRAFLVSDTSLTNGLVSENLVTGRPSSSANGQYAFVFTGQGAQWPQMGKHLIEEYPEFANAISDMDGILQSLDHPPQWNLKEALVASAESSNIQHVSQSQPACTAVQIALVCLLDSWGIRPAAVVGHSSGEIAAAFAAGRLSLGEAITAAYYRGYAVALDTGDGAMAAVGLSKSEADAAIKEMSLGGQANVACVNSPESVTVSGDRDAVQHLVETLAGRGTFARTLKTGGRAYHSHHMARIGQNYEDLLRSALEKLEPSVQLDAGNVTWVSTVTGQLSESAPDAAYWRSNLESPVLFSDGVEKMTEIDKYHFIELGPHSALEMPIKQIKKKLALSDDHFPYASALSRGKNEVTTILRMVGQLYLRGESVCWSKVNGLQSDCSVLPDLPPYPWTYDAALWHECRASIEFRTRKYPRHELLGSQIPGGNGLEAQWRNVIRVADIPWLDSHKLQNTIVFPGAGYVSMAVEGMRQIAGFATSSPANYELQNVNILAALALTDSPTAEVELFTTIRPTPITSASDSKYWYDFSIVSYDQGDSTTRATGRVRINPEAESLVQNVQINPAMLESTQPRVWYENLIKVGLNFGPAFQSIQRFDVSRMRTDLVCKTQVPLLQDYVSEGLDVEYPIHPITIDAMLQTAIVATTGGRVRELRAKVPVSFDSIHIHAPEPSDATTKSWAIDSVARVVGFGTSEIDAELSTSDGQVAARIANVKLSPYQTGQGADAGEQRHPMLRVLWKPDVYGLGLMPEDHFRKYLSKFFNESTSPVRDEGLLKMGATLDLLSHKNPSMRVLELGNVNHLITNATLDLLHGGDSFPRVLEFTSGLIKDDGVLHGTKLDLGKRLDGPLEHHAAIDDSKYDLIILPAREQTDIYLATKLPIIKDLLAEDGSLLCLSPSTARLHAAENGFQAIECILEYGGGRVFLAKPVADPATSGVQQSPVYVIDRSTSTALGESIVAELHKTYGPESCKHVYLDDLVDGMIPTGATIISLIESENPVLSTSTDSELRGIKLMTDNAETLLWVTAGDSLNGAQPEFALVSGLARAVMMEHPSLKFYTFDVDNPTTKTPVTAKNILSVLHSREFPRDYEYIQNDGLVHVSRFVPDDHLNVTFRQRQGHEMVQTTLQQARPAKLQILEPGNFDSLFFDQMRPLPATLEDRFSVQVGLRTVGVNAKDFYVLGGKTETKDATCALEFCGVVENVGAAVTRVAVGDRVVVMAPNHFRTSEVVPEWSCQKLEENESFEFMCTLPVVYATAIYALHDRARIQPGETVLIHSAAGGVGIAAIQIAQEAQAEIFATVSSEDKKNYLVETLGLSEDHIFSSRDTSFYEGIMRATQNRGVDIVLNSLVGDLLHASWKCCASFGRFIEIGKRDLIDCGKLEMDGFLRNTTYTAFDLSNMFYNPSDAYHKRWASLLEDVLSRYRAGTIGRANPITTFDVADATKAFRYFSSRNRMGKVVITLENPQAQVALRPQKHRTTFSANKSYVMIGCLGGLGRAMTKWMMARGARGFVFLGRSGTDKPSAQALIHDLETQGAVCVVVRGDVCSRADVDQVVAAAPGPIGGVVQAAMGLHEALFTTMSNAAWHTGIDPKVQGTLNLHRALEGHDAALEFFLMTSSISGSVGTATESNYCAGNHFLDMFARYRRALGKPAVALGLGMISEVGYLHENPEIEALLLRKGIQAINEDEMIQVIDIALSETQTVPHSYDERAHAHVLTGLEPFGLKELRKKGFEGTNPTLNDPRAILLSRALDGEGDMALKNQAGKLPMEVAAAVEEGASLRAAIGDHVARRFSNLVLMPLAKLDASKPLAAYGMDSMIAAEFRSWFFQAFKTDIPFLELLSKTVTLDSLSEMVLVDVEADA
ncbi:type I polyketide synthase [Aspergillus luchuensis]|uniref:Type I iterative PKS n=1 Tax=Aspergillus kawachii TaxID=1069201 RepID=A0A7R7X512_ASPKA|nr:type I iterative PKS [Aspergillus luchuensis]BCS03320.1 type I iterative PKS [Aspergillus luchuensis]BCS14947.1 type I iterative PKS [Aspergillus luchuensis]GAA84851.1 polyketide synthase [Aspergillus luchuensis IFO 4308]